MSPTHLAPVPSRRARLRDHAARAFVVVSGAALVLGVHAAAHRVIPVRAWVRGAVPAAAPYFTHDERAGDGFHLQSAGGAVARGAHGGDLESTAPASANGAFELRALGGNTSARITLGDAADRPLATENGLAVYREAYPDVDVVANRVPGELEILYVARARPASPLRLRVDVGPSGSVRVEPTTHAAIVEDERHRPRLRVSRPLAIDARGRTRAGEYVVEGDSLRVAMRWEGLALPVVIDPGFTIPAWTILDDARVPGALVYDATSRSREAQIVHDSARDRTVLVRPVRSQQPGDRTFIAGRLGTAGDERYVAQRISQVQRSAQPGVAIGAAAAADWQRGYSLESETWEWDPARARWSRNDGAHLPGLVDPSLAFDSTRGVIVAYGGATPGLACARRFASGPTFYCTNADAGDRTYEYDGATWTARSIPSSPPPRLRAAMAYDEAHRRVVLFGGRALDTRDPSHWVDGEQGPPFPDNLAGDLRADTWTFDGTAWTELGTGASPPAREGAALVYDAARHVLVLAGGRTAESGAAVDALGIWELDGTDWRERAHPGDASLPRDLRTRTGAAAFYNPLRQRVVFFGGASAALDPCAMSDDDIAREKAARKGDPPAMEQLAATGCLGGYVHDTWEWDGATFARTGAAAYGGMVGGTPVFRATAGAVPWSAAGAASQAGGPAPSGDTPLLPWRYDSSPGHFPQRTWLERAYAASPPPPAGAGSADAGAPPASPSPGGDPPALVSPAFTSRVRPDVTFDAARGVATVFTADDGAAYEHDGARIARVSRDDSPFAAGTNDFFAATWDSSQGRVVLFDPLTAATWTSAGAGWERLAASNAPPLLTTDARTARDLVGRGNGAGTSIARTAALAAQLPRATFDRARGRVVLIYAGRLWELAGTAWISTPLPTAFTSCAAATLVSFDGARARTVITGCTLPGQTWEWDGATLTSQPASPYQAIVERPNPARLDAPVQGYQEARWHSTLQLQHQHPNAIFESPSLGGVATFDADGTLRVWNGTTWQAGPALPSGIQSRLVESWLADTSGMGGDLLTNGFPVNMNAIQGYDGLPSCVFPPLVEDRVRHRVLAFRDGPRGLLQFDASAAPPARAWKPAPLGVDGFDWTQDEITMAALGGMPLGATTRVNPMPFELLAVEQIVLQTISDPANRANDGGAPVLATQDPPAREQPVFEPWWSFRLLDDPTTGRVRVLTSRGALWELAGEDLAGLGEPCTSDATCAAGACSSEGVCCDVKRCSDTACMTCKGAHVGTCEPVAAGLPEPAGRCGAGACAGTCPGTGPTQTNVGGVITVAPPACVYDATRACGAGPSCASGVITAGGHCAPDASACLVPGMQLPACPVAGGQADLHTACVPPPQPCGAGLGCSADGVTCKTNCTSRADCTSRFTICDPVRQACVADTASTLATTLGITPAKNPPPRRHSPAEIAAVLTDAGLVADDAGRIPFEPTEDLTGSLLVPTFDPSLRGPELTYATCLDYLQACLVLNGNDPDACVASAPRCATATPWTSEPDAECCPQACLVEYLQARTTSSPVKALGGFAGSTCYLPERNP